jgi:hypothetical protein
LEASVRKTDISSKCDKVPQLQEGMEQFDNSSVEFSEFIEDPSLQQDEYDELNDETFGSSEPICKQFSSRS